MATGQNPTISAEFNRREERLTQAQAERLLQLRQNALTAREALLDEHEQKRSARIEFRFRQDQNRKGPAPAPGGIPGQGKPPQSKEEIEKARGEAERGVRKSEAEELRVFDEVTSEQERRFLGKALGIERDRALDGREPD